MARYTDKQVKSVLKQIKEDKKKKSSKSKSKSKESSLFDRLLGKKTKTKKSKSKNVKTKIENTSNVNNSSNENDSELVRNAIKNYEVEQKRSKQQKELDDEINRVKQDKNIGFFKRTLEVDALKVAKAVDKRLPQKAVNFIDKEENKFK